MTIDPLTVHTVCTYAQAMTTHHVSTEHGDLAYIDEGSGPATLFVHGVFLNSHVWRNAIDELRNDRRCLAIDLPAHGATRVTPGGRGATSSS